MNVTYPDCQSDDQNDCTLRAAACAFNVPYAEVSRLATDVYQRKPNRGMIHNPFRLTDDRPDNWCAMYNNLARRTGKTLIDVTDWHSSKTVRSRLRKLNPHGTYLVLLLTRKFGHIFCYKAGAVHDWMSKRSLRKVIRVWMVVNRPKKV